MIKEVLFSFAVLATAFWSSQVQAVVLQPGDIVVGDRDRFITGTSTIYRVDPTNGNREVISSSSVGTGADLIVANSLAIEQDGRILVVDSDQNSVVRIDPVTGNRNPGTNPAKQNKPNPAGIASNDN